MIDSFLHRRLTVEIDRAIRERNYIAAVELSERLHLWFGGVQLGDIGLLAARQAAKVLEDLLGDVCVFATDDGKAGGGRRVFMDRLMDSYGAISKPVYGTGTMSLQE